ncbi:MAG TPA: translation initiation factor IF-2 associated domain-containing protein, partial [Hyphomicrobiales bacterium]|nr:translation initiation factor IF-2 associated domain-containing protein [Hyphomicrobiales bacterium]
MNETKNPGEKTLSVAPKKTLTLKRSGVEQGTVRQSFSHGRTKAVVVEKKKRRIVPPDHEGKSEAELAAAPAVEPVEVVAPAAPREVEQKPKPKRPAVVLRQLTEEERDARAQALA